MNCGFSTRFSHEYRPLKNFSSQSISAKNKYFLLGHTKKYTYSSIEFFLFKKNQQLQCRILNRNNKIEFHVAWYAALKLLLRIARNPIRDGAITGYWFTIYFVED